MNELLAIFCYVSTLEWARGVGAAALRCEKWPFLFFAAACGLGALYLLVRLVTKRNDPWPRGSGAALALYAGFILLWLMTESLHRDLIAKSTAGATKNSLAAMREELGRYAAGQGSAPAGLAGLFPEMPRLIIPPAPHKNSAEVRVSSFADIRDGGSWLYVADSSAPALLVDCTHFDYNNRPWSSY